MANLSRIGQLLEEFSRLLSEGINDRFLFKSVFTAGAGGSGKTFIAENMFEGLGVKIFNSDDVVERVFKQIGLPLAFRPFELDKAEAPFAGAQVQLGKLQQKIRKQAQELSQARLPHWLNGMLGLVIDSTASSASYVTELRLMLENTGYDTSMVFVHTDLDVALKRNLTRDRKVPEDVLRRDWHAAQANIPVFKRVFGRDNFRIVDNNKKLKGDELREFEVKMRRAGMRLLNQPLENALGRLIIQRLRETGGKLISDLRDDPVFRAAKAATKI